MYLQVFNDQTLWFTTEPRTGHVGKSFTFAQMFNSLEMETLMFIRIEAADDNC